MTGCLEAKHLTSFPKLYIVGELGTSGETFVTGLAKRFVEIGWKGQAFVVSLVPFKDPNDLHKSNPELFLKKFLAYLRDAVWGVLDASWTEKKNGSGVEAPKPLYLN